MMEDCNIELWAGIEPFLLQVAFVRVSLLQQQEKELRQYVSLSIMPSKVIHMEACVRAPFPFRAG